MISVGFKGIVETTIEHSDGRIEKDVHSNLITALTPFAMGLEPWDDNAGGARPPLGIKEIIFGTNPTPPTFQQDIGIMTPVVTKTFSDWNSGVGTIMTSNMGQIWCLWAGKFELLESEGNGSTIHEMGLIYHYHSASLIKFLFARIVRAPIVKTNTMKVTVKWYICAQNPELAPVPDVTFIDPDIIP